MKVIIAGSRTMPDSDYPLIDKAIKEAGFVVSEVVSGRARGADTLGERWAEEHSIPVRMFPADWARYGKRAGMMRNKEMREYADALVVFIYKESKGSTNMRQQMLKANKPVLSVWDGKGYD